MWTDLEELVLKNKYPVYGKKYCMDILGKTEAQIRQKASQMGLKLEHGTEFCNEWQGRARASKVGKKRPDQAEVMRGLHRSGKLKLNDAQKQKIGRYSAERIKKNGHPKGMLGKKHTIQAKKRMSQARKGKCFLTEKGRQKLSDASSLRMQQRIQNKGSVYSRSKNGWYVIGDRKIYLRSGWEVVYARSLEWMKQRGVIADWEYEPKTFWFVEIMRGVRSYTPDFLITNIDGTQEYHEVKGYMDAKSKTKIKRMAKYFPDVILKIVDKGVYKDVLKYNSLYPPATKVNK